MNQQNQLPQQLEDFLFKQDELSPDLCSHRNQRQSSQANQPQDLLLRNNHNEKLMDNIIKGRESLNFKPREMIIPSPSVLHTFKGTIAFKKGRYDEATANKQMQFLERVRKIEQEKLKIKKQKHFLREFFKNMIKFTLIVLVYLCLFLILRSKGLVPKFSARSLSTDFTVHSNESNYDLAFQEKTSVAQLNSSEPINESQWRNHVQLHSHFEVCDLQPKKLDTTEQQKIISKSSTETNSLAIMTQNKTGITKKRNQVKRTITMQLMEFDWKTGERIQIGSNTVHQYHPIQPDATNQTDH